MGCLFSIFKKEEIIDSSSFLSENIKKEDKYTNTEAFDFPDSPPRYYYNRYYGWD